MCTGSLLQSNLSADLNKQLKRYINRISINTVIFLRILSQVFRFRNVTVQKVIIHRGKLFRNKIFYFFPKKEAEEIRKRKIYKTIHNYVC